MPRCALRSLSRSQVECRCGWAEKLTGRVGHCCRVNQERLLRDYREHRGIVAPARNGVGE